MCVCGQSLIVLHLFVACTGFDTKPKRELIIITTIVVKYLLKILLNSIFYLVSITDEIGKLPI